MNAMILFTNILNVLIYEHKVANKKSRFRVMGRIQLNSSFSFKEKVKR